VNSDSRQWLIGLPVDYITVQLERLAQSNGRSGIQQDCSQKNPVRHVRGKCNPILPLWNGKPVMVEVTGTAPRAGLRQAAVDLALREALRTGKTCRIEDRVSVDPAMLRHAA